MLFEVLGPVRARGADGHVVATPRLERMLLAVLLLEPGRVVPVAELVDALWGPLAPKRARNQVHKCVSGLRGRLAAAGVPAHVIVTDAAGYQLQASPETVDLLEFRALVAQGRAEAAGRRFAAARDRYRGALRLWRGPALAGLDSVVLVSAAEALEQERVRAVEECLDAELAAGGAGELVAEVTDLVRRHPYREGLHAALMTALYRGGRAAEALAAYRRARELLRADLGTEPGERLRQLHRAVLRRDPSLEVAAPAPRAAPTPRELPVEASCFVGREAEARRMSDVLRSAGAGRRRPAAVLLYGPGGVGKSALATRVGQEWAGSFLDGQLYVDLCGSTPGMRPVPAEEALGRMLRSLGVDPREVASGEANAAALFRSVTAQLRLLVVLDNAADAAQVAPLVPAAGSCAVVVTSRHPLPVLDVDDRIRLPGLAQVEARALLDGLARGRVVETAAAQAILQVAGGLPLAIRVAGGRLAARPDLPAAEYAQRLADRSRRLDELALDQLDVRSCIRVSYDALLGGDRVARLAARAFRTLGTLHVPDVAAGVVAAMLDERDVDVAGAALDRLVAAQLLEPVPGGRYRLHDLVRLVAGELTAEHDQPADREATFRRAISYYIGGLKLVEDLRRPGRMQTWGAAPTRPETTPPAITSIADARSWLDAELPAVLAAFEQACRTADLVMSHLAWWGGAVWDNLDRRCEWLAAQRVGTLLLETAEQAGAVEATAFAWLLRGRGEATAADYEDAFSSFHRSLTMMSQLGNEPGAALALVGLGLTSDWCGELRAALRHYQDALALAERERLGALIAIIHCNLSVVHSQLGQLDEALGHARRGVALSRARKDLQASSTALNNLAAVHGLRGEYDEALRRVDQALAVSHEVGDRLVYCEGTVIRSEINRRAGLLAEASIDIENALARARDSGYGYIESAAHRQLARIHGTESRRPSERRADHAPRLRRRHGDSMIELLFRERAYPDGNSSLPTGLPARDAPLSVVSRSPAG